MVPIAGIGNVAGPLEQRPSRDRAVRDGDVQAGGQADDAVFSQEALDAAAVAKAATDAAKNSAVRQERIEKAKANLRDGLYQMSDVVEQVAARLTPYL